MKKEEFFNIIGGIDEQKIAAASAAMTEQKKFHSAWVKWGAIAACAACLCVAAAGITHMSMPKNNDDRTVLKWTENFKADNYFKYNNTDTNSMVSQKVDSAIIPYAATRYFSDYRTQMETDAVIPVLSDYPVYSCRVCYNEDNSIFSVEFSWHQRGSTYSDLEIMAGYQEVEQIQDCIFIELDENGNIVPPSVTVTERDGIQIVAKGNKNRDKTITFQNDTAWYQISGSWNDSYEAMAELLDWVWEHPINFDLFTIDKGIDITYSSLEENPEAFCFYIPDFEKFDYVLGENCLVLKNGEPYSFEGHYYTGVDKDSVKNGSYHEKDGWMEVHWCIDTKPDYYDLQKCLGDISELTKQSVMDALSEGSNFSFMLNDCFIKVYTKEAEQAWMLLESLIK